MEIFKKEQLPTGSGTEFKEKRRELKLPAIEVQNKVVWVNPKFKEAPFNFKENKPSKLGVFFTTKPEKTGDKIKNFTVMPEKRTGRAGMLDAVIFQDDDGNKYRDVDLKGMGGFRLVDNMGGRENDYKYKISPTIVQPAISLLGYSLPQTEFGLMDQGYANSDIEATELFLENDIRTSRVIALIELEEILDEEGNKISIKDAKSRGMLLQDTTPVIEVRAFKTKERLGYLDSRDARGAVALEDARRIIAQELRKSPDQFSLDDYVEWFAKTLGKQLAKMRKLGLTHRYLHSQNITLDCRIVDLDSVLKVNEVLKSKRYEEDTEEEIYNIDYNQAEYELGVFLVNLGYYGKLDSYIDDLIDIYTEAYKRELKKGKVKKYLGKLFNLSNS